MIGHLQRNKAGRAVELFDRVHGVDDAELAAALSRRAAAAGRRLPVLVEVNVSGEASKFGVAPDGARAAARARGGAAGPGARRADDDRARRWSAPRTRAPGFARLRALRDAAERRLGRARCRSCRWA